MHKVKIPACRIGRQNSKFIFKLAVFLLLVLNCQLMITGYQCFAQERIVAVVNNEAITQKDLDDFVNFMRMQLSQGQTNKRQLEEKIKSMKTDLLNKLIEDRLILQEAKKSGIKVDELRVKARVDEIKSNYSSEIAFRDSLSKDGLTQADIETRIREQFLMHAIIEYKIKQGIVVNPAEVTEFYNNNVDQFRVPEQREFEAINVKDGVSAANEVYDALRTGHDLEEIAKDYAFTVNKLTAAANGQLKKEIEEVVFKLRLFELSRPVKIQETYYIFKLNKIIPPQKQSFIQAREEIYTFLLNKKMQEKLTTWVDELKKQSYIKILS